MKHLRLLPLLALLLLASCDSPTAPALHESESANATLHTGDGPLSKMQGSHLSPEMSRLLGHVRRATARFQQVSTAEEAGYQSTVECVSDPEGAGAMGVHYLNASLLGDGTFDALSPEVLVYEPQKNGRMRLVAVEYLVFLDNMDDPDTAPELIDHSFDGPSTHGLPPHYELHAWVWRDNPDGVFAEWNPQVGCAHS